jgi:hypothetical protein
MVFWIGFFSQKYPKLIDVKKTTLSILTGRFVHVMHGWAIKLDLVILTSKVIKEMTNYLTNR